MAVVSHGVGRRSDRRGDRRDDGRAGEGGGGLDEVTRAALERAEEAFEDAQSSAADEGDGEETQIARLTQMVGAVGRGAPAGGHIQQEGNRRRLSSRLGP